MGRRLRLTFSGACYHVINHGNDRRNLFVSDGAVKLFGGCIGGVSTRHRWPVPAHATMRNRFHLTVKTPEPNPATG